MRAAEYSGGAFDPAAAQNARAFVDDASLSGRHAERRLVEHHLRTVRIVERKRAADRRLRRTEFHGDATQVLTLTASEPIHIAQGDAPLPKRRARTHDDAPRIRLEAQHIKGLRAGDADSLALSDREVNDAPMPTEHLARFVDDLPRLDCPGPELRDEIAVRAGRDEANILAVGLRRDREIKAPCQRARLVFAETAQGKAQIIELRASRREEKVALVARIVGGTVELRPLLAAYAARVAPGRERVGD